MIANHSCIKNKQTIVIALRIYRITITNGFINI